MPQENRPAPVLAHLLPAGVLREARELARALQRDETFRRYLVRKMWLILPAGLLFGVVSGACAMGSARMVNWFVPLPLPQALRIPAALFFGFWFLAAMVSQVYVLLACMQRRALRQTDAAAPARTGSCAALVGAFVAFPLGALGSSEPAMALGVLAGALVVPAFYAFSR